MCNKQLSNKELRARRKTAQRILRQEGYVPKQIARGGHLHNLWESSPRPQISSTYGPELDRQVQILLQENPNISVPQMATTMGTPLKIDRGSVEFRNLSTRIYSSRRRLGLADPREATPETFTPVQTKATPETFTPTVATRIWVQDPLSQKHMLINTERSLIEFSLVESGTWDMGNTMQGKFLNTTSLEDMKAYLMVFAEAMP